jgi:hypothetical protein
MGARIRVGIVWPYRPARLHRLAESIFLNRFLGSLKVYKSELCAGFLNNLLGARNREGWVV